MALLDVSELSVRFGGHVALDAVRMQVEPGTITGLIGPNGAGKTTLFNCITGLLSPTSGGLTFDGRDISRLAPYERAQLGIARTFQRLELFTSLTVRDNIRVAGDIRNRWHQGRIDAGQEADRVMDLLGLTDLAHRDVSEVPTGMARRVEVGRALVTRPRLLLLDEPASGQDDEETLEFGDLLLRLVDDGTAILLVEHDVPLVMKVCSSMYVLDFGRILAQGTGEEIRANPAVLDAYLGTAS